MNRRELLAGTLAITCAKAAPACSGGDWLLVYRYTVNVQEQFLGAPIYETRETFDGQRFTSLEAAYKGAADIRQTGVLLPTLDRFGRESNVMPETITPMPHLMAEQLGIKGARP
jgi:hypothetical protein